jgi:alkanesulfonate monooxygenase SsuD/methylene tetrahydromethanopterin reductase-like flavin-dependent oxidoreductase (luciferase family)
MNQEPTKRQKRIAAAAEFFSLLKEAEEYERKAKKLRAKAKKLRDENPILANLDNRIDTFEEPTAKKRKTEKEQTTVVIVPEGSLDTSKKRKAVLLDPEQVARGILHYHEDATGERVSCRENHDILIDQ